MGNSQNTLWYGIVLEEFLNQYPKCKYMDVEQENDGSILVTRVINGKPFYVDFRLNKIYGFLPDNVFVCTMSPIKVDEEIQFISEIMSDKTLYVHKHYDYDGDEYKQIDIFRKYFNVWTREYKNGIIIGLTRREAPKINKVPPAALRKPLLIQGVKF